MQARPGPAASRRGSEAPQRSPKEREGENGSPRPLLQTPHGGGLALLQTRVRASRQEGPVRMQKTNLWLPGDGGGRDKLGDWG